MESGNLTEKKSILRTVITENLRIQLGGTKTPSYIDVSNALVDAMARQNHVIFARRGCGKTLLLHESARKLTGDIKAVYLNCEDFKHHSFPNVLIEIVDVLFLELEKNLTGWFGKKKKSRDLIQQLRKDLASLKADADQKSVKVEQKETHEKQAKVNANASLKKLDAGAGVGVDLGFASKQETQQSYSISNEKIQSLNVMLPRLKAMIREFFEASSAVKYIFLQIDDLYHLKRVDQPFVVDYVHRLCKDVPIKFKIATLRHASTLYADRDGQPIGAQERHDYQPINIDYTFSDFDRTRNQNLLILKEFGKQAGMSGSEIDELFKGEGFDRIVMAGGGVPRDTLSLFIEVMASVAAREDKRVGKDDVRILTKANFERRIEELKADSEGGEQDILMRGIYVLRDFCLDRQTNVFVISEKVLQQNDQLRTLVNRLLDYRIVHNCATALTHKSQPGTFQAFAIDIGCYAHLRKHSGRFNELDVSEDGAKERMRSAPTLDMESFTSLWQSSPKEELEKKLLSEDA